METRRENGDKAVSGRENPASNGATVGYEAKLWQMANTVVSLTFLTYISGAFGELQIRLEGEQK